MINDKQSRGYTIVVVIGIMVISLILLESVVLWLQNESRWTAKFSRSTKAFHVAEAGIDRSLWKLKSSTGTWQNAADGVVITGYDFDKSYDDITGGEYRIKFSSGPGTNEVTIVSEGRDSSTNEIRSIQVIYKNLMIQGGVIAGGVITWSNKLQVQWAPVLSHGDIDIDSNAASTYYPRKFSRQVVSCSDAGHPRDTNGLDPPNTDNIEWWSDYPVVEMPIIYFAGLRSSASGTGTLNVYKCTPGKGKGKCNGSGGHADDFQDCDGHADSKKNYVWYWDDNVEFTGGSDAIGIYGSVIVRGNMRIASNTGDNYSFTCDVPDGAWEEYAKLTKSVGDTAASDEYPADDGYQTNRATFDLGGETWAVSNGGPANAADTDVGFRGFLYVGGDLDISGPTDVYGAIWVVGNVTKAAGVSSTNIFYDENITIPTLNVILQRQLWKEIGSDTTAWP